LKNNIVLKIGKLWFKQRGFSPVPLLLLSIFWPKYDTKSFLICIFVGIFVALSGELGRIWCVGYAGGITRTRSGDLNSLVTAGPYSYVRNPIYIFNIIMYCGACIMLGTPILLPFAIVYFVLQYTFIIYFEETILEEKFGDSYLRYKSLVRRWFPSLYIKIIRSAHSFNLKEALYSERRTLTAILVLLVIAVIKHLVFANWG
jgi:protein-S-isoprenylcysteine O-methyltransferase Ste14